MNENRTTKTESMNRHVGARVPEQVAAVIKQVAELEDRPVAYVVRRALINQFGQKNV